MRLLYINENDHELYFTDMDAGFHNYFLDHMVTFRQMWEEQGKLFWMRYLVAFRDYMYDKGHGQTFIEKAGLVFGVDEMTMLGDGVFVNIARQFILGRINDARDFIGDVVCLARNRHLLLNVGKKSIVNNPLYMKPARDSFRRLLLYPKLVPLHNQDMTVFYIGFVIPIYSKFSGGVLLLLKRWITSKNCPESPLPVYWPVPTKWMSGTAITPFQCFLSRTIPDQVDEMCGVTGMQKTLNERMSKLNDEPNLRKARDWKENKEHKEADGRFLSSEERELIERKVYLMAKKQFLMEARLKKKFEEEVHCKEHVHVHMNNTRSKKKKKKNAIRSAIEMAGKQGNDVAQHSDSQNGETSPLERASPSKKTQPEAKMKKGDLDSQLDQIKENIDMIESQVEKEGGLDYESFMLMLRTGALLTGKTEATSEEDHVCRKKANLNNCSHCGKKEDIPKAFKKCSRCKVENIDNPRFYCSRECQVEDWEECHRKEHSLFQKP